MRFYTTSAKFDKEFSNKDKTLVVQYSVKNEQKIECGGAYVKLYPGEVDQAHLGEGQAYKYVISNDVHSTARQTVEKL